MSVIRLWVWAVAMLCAASAWAGGAVNVNKDGLAVEGYDVVAYFVDKEPVKGKSEFSAKVDGATYLFSSAENLSIFVAEPARYQPQYGGYCAFGVAKGFKPEVDPKAFKVVDGKLYLNKNPDIASRWNADIPGFIKSANDNWKTLASK
jgi:YHS domain-containing protein